MIELNALGKILVIFGAILIIAGIIMTFANKIPFIGRLPGDILVEKKNFTFYFPLATSILISVILSIMLIFLNRK